MNKNVGIMNHKFLSYFVCFMKYVRSIASYSTTALCSNEYIIFVTELNKNIDPIII